MTYQKCDNKLTCSLEVKFDWKGHKGSKKLGWINGVKGEIDCELVEQTKSL